MGPKRLPRETVICAHPDCSETFEIIIGGSGQINAHCNHTCSSSDPIVRAKNSAAKIKYYKRNPDARTGENNPMFGKMTGVLNPRWVPEEEWIGAYPKDCDGELRESIRMRDNHTCAECLVQWQPWDNIYPVHHIDYDKYNSDPLNLLTMCTHCHSITSGYGPVKREICTRKYQNLMEIRFPTN